MRPGLHIQQRRVQFAQIWAFYRAFAPLLLSPRTHFAKADGSCVDSRPDSVHSIVINRSIDFQRVEHVSTRQSLEEARGRDLVCRPLGQEVAFMTGIERNSAAFELFLELETGNMAGSGLRTGSALFSVL